MSFSSNSTLRDVYLAKGELHKFFEQTTPVALWRFRKAEQANEHPFMPELQGFMTKTGFRRPDIEMYDHPKTGITMVKAGTGGVSLFDGPFSMKSKGEYFVLPEGTVLPAGLCITKENWNPRFGANHYSIQPCFDMALSQFLALLHHLATSLQTYR